MLPVNFTQSPSYTWITPSHKTASPFAVQNFSPTTSSTNTDVYFGKRGRRVSLAMAAALLVGALGNLTACSSDGPEQGSSALPSASASHRTADKPTNYAPTADSLGTRITITPSDGAKPYYRVTGSAEGSVLYYFNTPDTATASEQLLQKDKVSEAANSLASAMRKALNERPGGPFNDYYLNLNISPLASNPFSSALPLGQPQVSWGTGLALGKMRIQLADGTQWVIIGQTAHSTV